MNDNITLPREVVELALEALEWSWGGEPMGTKELAAITALRTALAAEPTKPKPEPVAWLSRDEARLALWKSINSRKFGNPTDDKLILDHLRQQGLWIGKVTSPAPPDAPTVKESLTHPGYVIGNHWFETAYERLCAGEAEDAILEDYEVVREPRLRDLRRDAERYRWVLGWLVRSGLLSCETCRIDSPASYGNWWILRKPRSIDGGSFVAYGADLKDTIDAAMEASTAPASAAADASTAPEDKT